MSTYVNGSIPTIVASLELVGNEEKVNEVKNFLRNELNENGQNLLIDFNRIIKKPEDMSIFINDPKSEDQLWYARCEGHKFFHTIIGGMMTSDDGSLNNCNVDERWCLKNWGCLGNPEDQEMGNENTYEFTLLYGGAFQIFEKLSSMYPEIVLVADLYRRSIDDGLFIFKNGKLIRYYYYEELYYDWHKYKKPLLPSSKLENKIWNHIAEIRSIISDRNKTL